VKRVSSPDEVSGEGTRLHFGVAKIQFATDTSATIGEQDSANGPRGDKSELNATLMAKGGSAPADWANAHATMAQVKGHVLRCDLVGLPGLGAGFVTVGPRSALRRGKVDGKMMWITVAYSELGVSPGQSVRISFMDQGNTVYADGEKLPSFRLKLQ
jgi:hypothetical protein